jgi:hypothetical protein
MLDPGGAPKPGGANIAIGQDPSSIGQGRRACCAFAGAYRDSKWLFVTEPKAGNGVSRDTLPAVKIVVMAFDGL